MSIFGLLVRRHIEGVAGQAPEPPAPPHPLEPDGRASHPDHPEAIGEHAEAVVAGTAPSTT